MNNKNCREILYMDQFEEKKVAGFSFIKIGKFYNNEESIPVKYEGKNIDITLSLNLFNDEFKKIGESAYLIFSDNDLMYVGEYSFNLKDRWLRNGEYVWHHKDRKILDALNENKNVTLWITLNPYIKIDKDFTINISKSIEREVLKQREVPWNRRGKTKIYKEWICDNCIKLEDIIK